MKESKFVVIPSMSGIDDEVSISLINATFQEKDDFVRKYPHPEFGPWLVEQISKRDKIFAIKKGLFKKVYVCPSCSSELNPDSRKPVEKVFELKYLDFSPFTVKLTVPSVECPQCKTICEIEIKNSLDYHIAEALIRSFETQNIKP